ncbi:DUF998 domain-containing protein [Amycolatopsis acidicola]|uniref:DUF998 domain-containing protein n=1 Tax=Amycolatopsis acidicola TaxID=2596893 RepID=A0A5N0UJJ3_9PSEU|nr:DUF998 domain-containing protein [Amycolatopsis acidicola]KAA9148556.1 DUF998 domain-containing protein [Amycolatopsis acidicola]
MPTTGEPTGERTSEPGTRAPAALAVSGVLALAAGAILILLLQFLPPTSEISPLRRTISEYALTANKWMFDIAVVLVAAGSALLFALHLLRRALPVPALVAGALWTVSLLVIVAFPKTNWAVGPSAGGTLHRVASVIGFVCLPIGLLLAARTTFTVARWRRAARILAVASLGWFAVILGAVAVSLAAGGHWWEVIPLGLVERLMALTELLAIATLAGPLLRSAR